MATDEAGHTANADAVFEGVATSMKVVAGPQHEYTFQVDRTIKGSVANPQTVRTSDNSAACGTTFTSGQAYRVFAHRQEDGRLSTGLCSGNRGVTLVPASTTTTATPRPTTSLRGTTTSATAPPETSTTTTIVPPPSTTTTTTTGAGVMEIATTSDGGGGNGALALGAAALATGALAGTGFVLYRRRLG